jgi:hypothetical protein
MLGFAFDLILVSKGFDLVWITQNNAVMMLYLVFCSVKVSLTTRSAGNGKTKETYLRTGVDKKTVSGRVCSGKGSSGKTGESTKLRMAIVKLSSQVSWCWCRHGVMGWLRSGSWQRRANSDRCFGIQHHKIATHSHCLSSISGGEYAEL